jgi:hypothetical protein
MQINPLEKFTRGLALVAGTLDFCTGLGLVFVPGRTLDLMRVAAPGFDAETFLRFTGVFVGLVGFSYLWALRRGSRELATVLALTCWFRVAVGLFASWAILSGRLPPAWWSVPATDFMLAVLQFWLLRKGVFRGAA